MSNLQKTRKYFLIISFILIHLNLWGQSRVIWKEPVNLSRLNTAEDDFAPSWNRFENCLYYNSVSAGFSKFFVADSLYDEKPEPAGGDLNKTNDNRSYICFDAEGRAYLTAFRMYTPRPYQNIFESRKDRNGWTMPFPVDSLKSESFNAHPTVSPDGSVMAFSTNRQSGRADADLWIAYKMENGSWGNPRPLNALNTNGNEITPFFASDDTLYFASDGQGGPGGFDIFVSANIMGIWQNPYPVNSINTRFNESDFIILPGGNAVFASDKPGGRGKLDLYTTTKEDSIKVIKQIQSEMEIEIAAQVSSVRAYLDLKYNYYPLITSVFDNYFSISDFSRHIPEIEEQVAPEPDSVYLYSPGIIGLRLRDNPTATIKLVLLTYGKTQHEIELIKQMADSLALFYAVNFGITKSRVAITENINLTGSPAGAVKPVIRIESDFPSILEPLGLGDLVIRAEPPVIQASIMARPEKDFRDFECELYINNKKTTYSFKGNDAAEPFYINLPDYQYSLAHSDSLVLKVTARDRYSNIVRETMNINTQVSESKSLAVKKIKNVQYYEYYYLLNEFEENTGFAGFIEKIKELCANAGSLKIYYYEPENSYSKEKAVMLSGLINEKTGGSCNFKVEYGTSPDKFAGVGKLKPYIVKLVMAFE